MHSGSTRATHTSSYIIMPPKGFNPPKPKGGTKPKAKGGKKRKNGYAMPKIEKQKKGAESKKAKALQALQSRCVKRRNCCYYLFSALVPRCFSRRWCQQCVVA